MIIITIITSVKVFQLMPYLKPVSSRTRWEAAAKGSNYTSKKPVAQDRITIPMEHISSFPTTHKPETLYIYLYIYIYTHLYTPNKKAPGTGYVDLSCACKVRRSNSWAVG